MTLNDPDWTTASRAAWAIDEFFGESGLAIAADASTLVVTIPGQFNSPQEMAGFLADLEKVVVIPDLPARVVVNEKTGTVIVGDHVSVAAVALSHGSLKLKIPGDSGQAADPLGGGQQISVEEEPDHLHPILNSFDVGAMPTVKDLVRNLNALGVSPREMIAILQALKTAGALRAELIIQ
jgi:flagellar P-ring protein precursor FlgI